MKLRLLILMALGAVLAHADGPATLLGSKIASMGYDAIVLAAADPNAPDAEPGPWLRGTPA